MANSKPERETRLLVCPTCNPQRDNPDRVTGNKETLKYLVFGRKCRNCGTVLEDLGVVANSEQVEEPDPIDRGAACIVQLREDCQQWLNWADGETGSVLYLASQMRLKISDRIELLTADNARLVAQQLTDATDWAADDTAIRELCRPYTDVDGVADRDLVEVVKDAIGRLVAEKDVLEDLLAQRQQVLDAIPPCEIHGSCVPHAIEWIDTATAKLSASSARDAGIREAAAEWQPIESAPEMKSVILWADTSADDVPNWRGRFN